MCQWCTTIANARKPRMRPLNPSWRAVAFASVNSTDPHGGTDILCCQMRGPLPLDIAMRLSPPASKLWLCLRCLANDDGYVHMSTREIASTLELDRSRGVIGPLRELSNASLVRKGRCWLQLATNDAHTLYILSNGSVQQPNTGRHANNGRLVAIHDQASSSSKATQDAHASTEPTGTTNPLLDTSTTTTNPRPRASNSRAEVEEIVGRLVGIGVGLASAKQMAHSYPHTHVFYALDTVKAHPPRRADRVRAYVRSILDSDDIDAQVSDWLAEQDRREAARRQREAESRLAAERARLAMLQAREEERAAEAERRRVRAEMGPMSQRQRQDLLREAISMADGAVRQMLLARLSDFVRRGEDLTQVACRPSIRGLVVAVLERRQAGPRYVEEYQ